MGLGGSLFSSKSKSSSSSTTTTTNNTTDNSRTVSSTVGDLSRNNMIAGGDATMYGYSADDTKSILETTLKYINNAVDGIKDTTGKAITQVQSAYSGANNAILESQNETKALLNSLRPYALYAAIAAGIYFIFGKRKR